MSNEEQFKDSLRKMMESKSFPFDESNWQKMQHQMDSEGAAFESGEESQFKDSLQNLVDSKEFAFDRSNWKEMKKLLPEEEPSRYRVFWYAAAALLLLMSGTLAYLFLGGDPKTPAMASHSQPVPSPDASLNALPQPRDHAGPAPAMPHKTSTDAVKLQKEPALKPTSTSPAGSSILPGTSGPATAAAQPERTKSPELHTVPAPQPAQPSRVAKQPDQPLVLPEKQAQPVTASSPAHSSTPAVIGSEPVTTPGSSKDNTSASSKDHSPAPSKDEPAATQAKQNTGNNDPGRSAPVSQSGNETTVSTPDIPAAPQKTMGEVLDPATAVANPTVNPDQPETAKPIQPEAAKPDSAAIANATVPPTPASKRMIMSFELGADYLTGWKNPGKTDANGINPVAGFCYYNYLTDKLSVSLGLQYTTVSHLSYYSHVSKITHFDLGIQNSVTVITPEKLYYLGLPVKANYAINDDNMIGGGFNFSYLLGSDSKVETYDEQSGRQSNYRSYKGTGYTEGFANFDTRASVFYRRRLYRNLFVNAELMYGLTDIKSNGFFNSPVSERNTGLRLTLMYTLFK